MLGFKLPQDDRKYQWTNHVKDKMIYYQISESLVKRVVKFPKRIEEGVTPKTVAVMQSRQIGGRNKRTEEVWVMFQEINQKSKVKNQNDNSKFKKLIPNPLSLTPACKRIISAWRYPGTSPAGKPIPIPDDILQELETLLD